MTYIRNLFILFLMALVLVSCIEPPEEMEKVNMLDFMKEVLDTAYTLKDDEKKLNEYLSGLIKNRQYLLVLYKGSVINISSKETTPAEDDIGYSLTGNRFKLLRPLYVTFEKKDTIFSFDNKVWYSSKSDQAKKIEAVYQKIDYKTVYERNNLSIEYQATFKLGRNPLKAEVTPGKQIITLEKGMILSSPDVTSVNENLEKSILYIPAGSIVTANLSMEGNIMSGFRRDEKMIFKSMTDIYIYLKKNMFSISFDHENWNSNILSFDINPVFEVKVDNDNIINFNIIVNANYDKSKISLSIVKLLLSMRR